MPPYIKDDSFYYKYLPQFSSDEIIRKFIDSRNQILNKDLRNWDYQKNSEWVLRIYLASKLILSATVLLESALYTQKKNVLITIPYLLYYGLLSCCRSLLYTSPNDDFSKIYPEKIVTHEKAINVTIDILNLFNKEGTNIFYELLNSAKRQREMFSYNFPSTGLSILKETRITIEETVELCNLLCEIAQLQSAIIQRFVEKRSLQTDLITTPVYLACKYGNEKIMYVDAEDECRVFDMLRKWKQPYSIILTMGEGWVEDYFGAWSIDRTQAESDIFNPDENWQLIFPVP